MKTIGIRKRRLDRSTVVSFVTSLFYYIISTYVNFLSSLCLIMTVERSKTSLSYPDSFYYKIFITVYIKKFTNDQLRK